MSAKALDEQYGPELSRPPLADCGSAYFLHQALRAKGVEVSHQACKVWWSKYRVVPGQVSISTADELEEPQANIRTDIHTCMFDKIEKSCTKLAPR